MPELNSPVTDARTGPSETKTVSAKSRSSERSIDTKNLLLCLGVLTASVVLAWPFADMASGDDVAYAHVAYVLSQTGRLIFNGWEAAMMVQQAYWGALFIKLFGFSFLCVRLSTIPFALGAVALCYLLVRRAGLGSSKSAFVTLLLGTSPIFLPVAVSYMTDVPGLFFLFTSLYALARAAEGCDQMNGVLWLALSVAAGLVGGTGRQTVWFVPLVVLPYLAWARRRNIRFAACCWAGWVLSLGCVAGITGWFDHQPYVVPTPSLLNELKQAVRHPAGEVEVSARLLLMLLLMSFPAALPLILRSWSDTWGGSRGRKILLVSLLFAVTGAILIHPSLASIPWVSNTLNWQGIYGDAPLPGRPIVLIRPIRAVIAVAVYVAACILAGEFTKIPEVARRGWRAFRNPSGSEFTLIAMSLVSGVYFVMIILRAVEFSPYDRYLLPLLPCTATVLLRLFETRNSNAEGMQRRVMPWCWGVVIVFGAYAILSTQDYWSLARARVTATERLERAGVPRAVVDAGMEYNSWTQLMINGHLNWRYVKNPPGAYLPGFGITPDVNPAYRLEYAPGLPETAPSEFGSVPYFSLLPPFHKQVSIDRVVAPSNRNL